MSEKKNIYITTTLPYVNAEPHIGFALEIVQADALARSQRLIGHEVFFNTGSDEHGQKIYEAAEKAGEKVEAYVDRHAASFEKLKNALNLSYDKFIRTSDTHHIAAAQEMWKRCKEKGDIYEKEFEGLYCVGCERYLTERDLAGGLCAIHQSEPRLMKEKNWFFRLKKYEEPLLQYLSNPQSIIPDWRREEAINFVKEGLEDFSISRDKARLSWGIPVPGDETQVMYVWFDALTNYISTLGWPRSAEASRGEPDLFEKFWNQGETVQMAGKDQVRFQSIMWQAMLMSAEIKPTDKIFYHGFINSGGQKMSKSLGNVVSPFDLVEKYGTDATRYLLLRHVHSTEDTDVTWEKLDEWYLADLVNGVGNLVSRIMKMAEDNLSEPAPAVSFRFGPAEKMVEEFRFHDALNVLGANMGVIDLEIQNKQPFKLVKTNPEEAESMIISLVQNLSHLAMSLRPFIPEAAEKILQAIKENKKPENLFPRL